MMLAPPARRVSYTIPYPTRPVPLLALPPVDVARKGRMGPIYHQVSPSLDLPQPYDHPRHQLSIGALVLDLATEVEQGPRDGSGYDGRSGEAPQPGGILYSGSRDGLVCAWDLNLPTRRRRQPYGAPEPVEHDSDSDSDGSSMDGAVMNDPTQELADLPRKPRASLDARSRRNGFTRAPSGSSLGFQDKWEIDDDRIQHPTTSFRQCIEAHTNSVTDLVLVDYNRAVISASDDALVMCWRPHAQAQAAPTQLGFHDDYIRSLAGARDASWVASGGFDSQVKLWDIAEGRSQPIVEIPVEASIYSLATPPSGSLIAVGGSGKRLVRAFDPRSKKQVANLAGHTDMIRKVLIGDDGKWLLSASSDTTVKLWHLVNQKCLGTFSLHSSSVFSLFSQHPNLERFYSGDKNGNLCKVDLEGCGDPSEGEAILLARDGSDERADQVGINAIAARDDSFVWTADGSNSIKRWRDVPSRLRRAGAVRTRRKSIAGLMMTQEDSESTTGFLESGNGHGEKERAAGPSVAFLQGLTSTLSRTTSSPTAHFQPHLSLPPHRPTSLRIVSSSLKPLTYSFPAPSASLGGATLFDIPYSSLVPLTLPDEFIGVVARRRDPETATLYSTHTTSVYGQRRPLSLASPASPIGSGFHHSIAETTAAAESRADNAARMAYLDREGASEAVPLRESWDEVIPGRSGLIKCALLNDRRHVLALDSAGDIGLWDIIECRCWGVFDTTDIGGPRRPSTASGSSIPTALVSSRDLLELVRERIESQGATSTWCSVEARGRITVHLDEAYAYDAEIYADEAHLDPNLDLARDHRLNLGKWILHNLFYDFIAAESRHRRANAKVAPRVLEATGSAPESGTSTPTTRSQPNFISLAGLDRLPQSNGSKTPGMTIALSTSAARRAILSPDLPPSTGGIESFVDLTTDSPGNMTPGASTPRPHVSTSTSLDYFSLPTAPVVASVETPPIPVPSAPSTPLPTPGTTPGGGLMGRLRFGNRGSKKLADDKSSSLPLPAPEQTVNLEEPTLLSPEQQFRIARQNLLNRPLDPCPIMDAPALDLNRNSTSILISEKGEGGLWRVVYRGLVGSGEMDRSVLLRDSPSWLLEFILFNQAVCKEPPKISFVVLPCEGMPALPNINARLTANRNLRVRKVISYVGDKLELPSTRSRAPSISSTFHMPAFAPITPVTPLHQATVLDFGVEDLEILCSGVVMPVQVTLAMIKTYYWKSSADVVLNYRVKQ